MHLSLIPYPFRISRDDSFVSNITCRSNKCFGQLGWPMKANANFFCKTAQQLGPDKREVCVQLEKSLGDRLCFELIPC